MPRVIVVEDSPTQAQQLAFILEDAGFEVETAPDAEHGFERLERGRFDVVLSDLHLPGDSGFDLCRRIKADPRFRRIPVVVCTSEADPVNALRGLQAGADGFMTKGRESSAIAACVERVLARAPSDGAAEPIRAPFLGQEFVLAADRAQLVDILVSAFEEVVYLNEQYQASETALRELNRRLEERNGELRTALKKLKQTQSQLVQAEKLSSLGQLVAGVAHEINNPLAFVLNNMTVLKRDVGSLQQVLAAYQEGETVLAEHQPERLERIRRLADESDLPYTLENLDGLILRTVEGLRRIQRIVMDLRDFARLDESDLKEVDVNVGIESTISIINPRAREQQVSLETDLAPVPKITCYPAKINQVVLNLVANAIDACPQGGRVTVSTRRADEGVEIQVADTGRGIDPSIRDKIFDPFVTTKPQGKGTGLGLSISYGIVQAHGGRITFQSSPGDTRFIVHLPSEPMPAGASSGGIV